MKKTYFALGFIFLASATHAQNDTELKKIALEICPCLTKMLPQKYTNPEVLQLDFGMCYINVAEKYPAVFKKHDINILEMDNQEGAKLGTLMMPYLQAECPAFLDVLYKLEDFYQEDEKQDSFEEMSQYSMNGIFLGLENNQFAVINFKDETGKRHNLYWLHYFEGSDLLIDDAKLFEGKSATIMYDEYEFYVPSSKTNNRIKVVSGITFE